MRRFDVTSHQPHPPGYPLFILAARAARSAAPSEAKAMAAISVAAGTLGVLAIVALFRRLDDGPTGQGMWPLVGGAMAMTTPLYWFTAARPLSDMMGLAAAIGIQVLIVSATTPRALALAAFLAGLGIGIRSQVLWLTAPLLIWAFLKAPGTRAPGTQAPGTPHPAPALITHHPSPGTLGAALALFSGALLWFVPLVILTGGPASYWHALFNQGAEDLSGIRMLWTTPTPRALAAALYYALVAPWADWMLAAAVVALAAVGGLTLLARRRRALVILAAGFGPYLVFDLLFQETFTSRYALPLVVPLAFLAVSAVRAAPLPLALVAVTPIAAYGAHIGGRSIAEYSRQPAPAFRLLEDMRRATESLPVRPVFAPDRRQSFDLRRPLVWAGDAAPAFDRQLPAPPQHEWLEAVKYWDAGGRAPIWFVVDPRRAAIDLVQHGRPATYRWSLPFPVLLSGTRPNDADWYRVERPEWYVAEGWALTPEAAGVAEVDRRGLSEGAIHASIRRDAADGGWLLIGGRNFEAALRPRLIATLAGRRVGADEPLAPGPFLSLIRLPEDLAGGDSDYVRLEIKSDPPARLAIEQLDASSARGVLGFGEGWQEREFNPVTGRQWRWLSGRGELRYVTPARGAVLHIAGESPLLYYDRPSRVIVRVGGRVIGETTASSDFVMDVEVPASLGPATVSIETDQTHVPAERSWRGSADRRRLGLRIFDCELRPVRQASAPGRAASFPPARRTIGATRFPAGAAPSTAR